MPWSIETLFLVIITWTFAKAQDVWFGKLMQYQIRGDANRLKVHPSQSLNVFARLNSVRAHWIVLAIGLTCVVLSFPTRLSDSLRAALIGIGAFICLFYIYQKVQQYRQSIVVLKSGRLAVGDD